MNLRDRSNQIMRKIKEIFDNVIGNYFLTVTVDHNNIHKGLYYESYLKITIPAGESRFILYQTPLESEAIIHLRPSVVLTNKEHTDIFFYEGTAYTAGAAMTSIANHNRKSANINTMLVTQAVVNGSKGTLLNGTAIFGAIGVGNTRSGGELGKGAEWVLENEEFYLVEFANLSAEAQTTVIKNNWYEII